MSRFDSWVKRFRTLGEQKTHERVLTHSKYEILTSTQAWRFKQLQHFRVGRKETTRFMVKPHYPLPEACARLGTTVSEMLLAAARNDVECLVLSDGLRGRWHTGDEEDTRDTPAAGELPPYLALSAENCRDIESNGSVNVTELERPSSSVPPSGRADRKPRFRLLEPLWVDPQKIVLRHPLPESSAGS